MKRDERFQNHHLDREPRKNKSDDKNLKFISELKSQNFFFSSFLAHSFNHSFNDRKLANWRVARSNVRWRNNRLKKREKIEAKTNHQNAFFFFLHFRKSFFFLFDTDSNNQIIISLEFWSKSKLESKIRYESNRFWRFVFRD